MNIGFNIDIKLKKGYISTISLDFIYTFELWFIICHLPIIYKCYKNGFRTMNAWGYDIFK